MPRPASARGCLVGPACPGRTTGQAELLAHHYTKALTYAQAAGSASAALVDYARLALRAAGDHAIAIGTDALAARYYTEALALWPADDPDRPELQLRAGEAYLFREGAGEELLTNARNDLLARGNRERAAEAEARLGQLAYFQGRKRSSHMDRALALVADASPSPSKAVVLSHCMMHLLAADRHPEALAVAREVLAMARRFHDPQTSAAALGTNGAARVNLGDAGGVADLERCAALYEEQGSPAVISWHNNLAYSLAILGDLGGYSDYRRGCRQAAERLAQTTNGAGWKWKAPLSTTGAGSGTTRSGSLTPGWPMPPVYRT